MIMRSHFKKIFYVLLAIAFLTLGWGLYAYYQEGTFQENKHVTIYKGQSLFDIAHVLVAKKIIGNPYLFSFSMIATGKRAHIKAGEYEFEPRSSIQKVAEKLVKGRVYLHKLTIPEGLTSHQVREILKAQDYLVADTDALPPEGTLLPETYSVPRGTTYSELYRLMEQKMIEFLTEAWDSRSPGLPFSSPYEALILASIVEKETSLKNEKPHVAAVFINRLKLGMPLQADPTVVYVLAKGQGSYGKKLLTADLKKNFPHNTYINKGLPPTPIAMAGTGAILAVLNPKITNDIYFVASGDGGHRFSNTLIAHNKNVFQYRKNKIKGKI